MALFQVTLHQQVVEKRVLFVEAPSEEQAREVGEGVFDGRLTHLDTDWEQCDILERGVALVQPVNTQVRPDAVWSEEEPEEEA